MRRLLFVVLLFPTWLWAQETCIPTTDFADMLKHLQNLQTLEHALPKITLDALNVTVDRDGHVFFPEKLLGTLVLGYLRFSLEVKNSVTVYKQPPREPLFGFRYKAGAYFDVLHADSSGRFGGLFLIEPIHHWNVGLNAYLGTTSSGGALSVDVTKNFSTLTGAGVSYEDRSLSLVVGASFSFN